VLYSILVFTFRVGRRRCEMYCGDSRLCVCVCPWPHAYTIAIACIRINLGEW